MIFNILDNTTELWMTKYIIGEFFSSGGATLYKNPSDPTVYSKIGWRVNDTSFSDNSVLMSYKKSLNYFLFNNKKPGEKNCRSQEP